MFSFAWSEPDFPNIQSVISHSPLCFCPFSRKAALLFGWAVFLLLAYKVSKLDREYQEYNPYEVLNLDPVNPIPTTHKIRAFVWP